MAASANLAAILAAGRAMAPVRVNRLVLAVLVLLSMHVGAAVADTDEMVAATATPPMPSAMSLATAVPTPVPAATSAPAQQPAVMTAFGKALDGAQLEGQRGGAETAAPLPASSIFTSGSVTDNRAVDVITGSNSIRDGAFTNASGLPIVIQNTGANVLIQNATIVNVQLR